MKYKIPNARFRSLFIRITLPSLVLGFMLAIGLATELELESTKNLNQLYERQIKAVYLSTLEEALWMASFGDLNNVSQVLLSFENIEGVKIVFKDLPPIVSIGDFSSLDIEKTQLKSIGGGASGDWKLIIAKKPTNSTLIIISTIKRITLPFLLFGGIFAGAVYFALRTLVVKPSAALSEAMTTYQSSGKIEQIPPDGCQEMRQIIEGYNHMAEAISRESEWQKTRADLFSAQAKSIDNFSKTLNNVNLPLQTASLSFIENILAIPYLTFAVVNIEHSLSQVFIHNKKNASNSSLEEETLNILRKIKPTSHKTHLSVNIHGRLAKLICKPLQSPEDCFGKVFVELTTNIPSIEDNIELFISSMSSTFSAFIEAKMRLKEKQSSSATHAALFSALEGMNTGITVIDKNRKVLAVNQSAQRHLDQSPAQYTHSHPNGEVSIYNVTCNDQERFYTWLSEPNNSLDFEIQLDNQQWLSISRAPLPDERQVLLWRDTTAYKQYLENQAHDSKMRAVGRVTGGITHDFNNFLQAISGNLDIALLRLAKDDAAQSSIKNAIANCHSAAKMTDQLLQFSHKSNSSSESIETNELIARWKNTLEAQWSGKFLIDIDIQTNRRAIINAEQLLRALVNLAKNSIDAKKEGKAHLQLSVNEKLGFVQNKRCRMLSFVLQDNAGGIEPRLLHKVTEPFFTTKPQGQGTGLGMALIYDTVRDASGQMELRNVDNGLQVEILLPSTTAKANNQTDAAITSEALDLEDKRIVLIEDSPEIAELLNAFLTSKKAKVQLITNIQDFVSRSSELGNQTDLIISDVNLPDGNAIDLLNLHSWTKQCPCLFITGDPIAFANPKANRPMTAYLCKPFKLDHLLGKLVLLIQKTNTSQSSL